MKKLILSLVLISSFSILSAQKTENVIKETAVPEAVKKSFEAKHPGVKAIKWELDAGKYEVDFMKGTTKYIAVFDPAGKWLITGTEIKKEDVPKKILDHALSGEYSTWKFNQARLIETPEIAKEYVVEVEKGDDDTMLYYDADGNFLRTKKE